VLHNLGRAYEVEVTTLRSDGTLRRWVPIWVVAVQDEMYVRSWKGTHGAWYRHAVARGEGRVRVGRTGSGQAVRFVPVPPSSPVQSAIDDAYREKYVSAGPAYVNPMVAEHAVATTLRLDPR
jgi:hypothetical protein